MPRYFFNLVHQEKTVEDLEGVDLLGEAAAREEASLFAQSISEGRSQDARDWTGWVVVILDDAGVPVDRIPIISVS